VSERRGIGGVPGGTSSPWQPHWQFRHWPGVWPALIAGGLESFVSSEFDTASDPEQQPQQVVRDLEVDWVAADLDEQQLSDVPQQSPWHTPLFAHELRW
jgi:hypothetical protein